jgi:hypothetical protein
MGVGTVSIAIAAAFSASGPKLGTEMMLNQKVVK